MNKINFPKAITPDLAYLAGFINGDGHLCYRKDKNEYSIFCSGNLKDEVEFYNQILIPLFKELFNVNMKIKTQKSNSTYNLIFYSKELFTFLSDKLSIPTGAKSSIVRVPEIIKGLGLTKEFICGFADADFSFMIKKRYRKIPYYPIISGASKSKMIIEDIADFLKENEIPFYKKLDKTIKDRRYGSSKISILTVYGHDNLARWMKTVGFRNAKILRKIELWKERNRNNPRAKHALESISSSGGTI